MFFITVSVAESCVGTTDILGQIIRSPNYPQNYSLDKKCTWKLTAPKGKILHLNMTQFHTDLYYHTLMIRDEASSSSSLMAELSGSLVPKEYKSTKNAMFIEFSTDKFNAFGGFQIKYDVLDYPGGSIILNTEV